MKKQLSAYGLSFSLDFLSARLSRQFAEFYRGNQRFFLEVYSVLLIFFMVFEYFVAVCEEKRENILCEHKTLYLFSILSLFLTFLLHKRVNNAYFSRILMVFGSFYSYLRVISLKFEHETCFLLVFLMVSAENFLISCSWKQHISLSLLTFGLISLYLWTFPCFLHKVRGLDKAIVATTAIFYVFVASLQDKLLKEVWSFIAFCTDRSQEIEKILCEIPAAFCVIDENHYIIAINRYCSQVFDGLENGFSFNGKNRENIRSFLHRNVEDFIEEKELADFKQMLEECRGSSGRVFSRVFKMEETQKRPLSKEDKNMKKIMSDLSEVAFGFGEDSSNHGETVLYELVVSEVPWKKNHRGHLEAPYFDNNCEPYNPLEVPIYDERPTDNFKEVPTDNIKEVPTKYFKKGPADTGQPLKNKKEGSPKCLLLHFKPLPTLQNYLKIKNNLEHLTHHNIDSLLSLIEDENFKNKSLPFINLPRPPALGFKHSHPRFSKQNNYELTPCLLELYEMKYFLALNRELSAYLQHQLPQNNELVFKFPDFLSHFLALFSSFARNKQKKSQEIAFSVEFPADFPDFLKGDCERLEQLFAAILLPVLKTFADIAKISLFCDLQRADAKNSVFLQCELEITRRNNDNLLENFVFSRTSSLFSATQSEVYEKFREKRDFLALVPFLLRTLQRDCAQTTADFSIETRDFRTVIRVSLPFSQEPANFIRSPSNFVKFNEIELDFLWQIVETQRKVCEKEFRVLRAERKSQRSFEDLHNFEKNARIEPSSSDSLKDSAKSSPLKRHKNHKILNLKEDLLKLVSPDNSSAEIRRETAIFRREAKPFRRKPLTFCEKVFEISVLPQKKPGFEDVRKEIESCARNLEENYRRILQETVNECLLQKKEVSLREIHEELFNIIIEENKSESFLEKTAENQSFSREIQGKWRISLIFSLKLAIFSRKPHESREIS